MSFTICLVVTAGGAIGTLARFLISMATLPVSRELPWGTIGINIADSFHHEVGHRVIRHLAMLVRVKNICKKYIN